MNNKVTYIQPSSGCNSLRVVLRGMKTLKFKPGCAEPSMTTLFPFIRIRAASGTTVICKECEEGHQMCEKEGEGYNMCWGEREGYLNCG